MTLLARVAAVLLCEVEGKGSCIMENGDEGGQKLVPPELALRGEEPRQRDLSDVAGTWIEDPEVDWALEEQRKIDPALWR